MKIIEIRRLIDRGPFSKSEMWKTIEANVRAAVKAVEWPPGSGSFTLFDQPGKARGEGSGVKPIKEACMLYLKSKGWQPELPVPGLAARFGPFDAGYKVGPQVFCVEWETGNISSSHRAMNKMAVGMLSGGLIGGLLILPTRKMYKYLTDRVGNFTELEPYFSLWESLPVLKGLLGVMAIEHDSTSKDVSRIPKGTDGRALI